MPSPVQRERRRQPRIAQSVSVRVVGYEASGLDWEEATTTRDVSAFGASFRLTHSSFKGQVLHLALPLPPRLRPVDDREPEYRVYAIVRDTVDGAGAWQVGVMFYGKHPPRGFERTPGAAFLLPSDLPEVGESTRSLPLANTEPEPEETAPDPRGRRRHERFDIFVDFLLQQVDEWGTMLDEERTVVENVSRGGARLKTSGRFAKGEVLMVKQVDHAFEARAAVRNAYLGADKVRRVNVEFLDGRTPDHLVRKR